MRWRQCAEPAVELPIRGSQIKNRFVHFLESTSMFIARLGQAALTFLLHSV